MVRAYVTLTTGAGWSTSVVEELRAMSAVERADLVAGDFDIITEVYAESPQALLELVTEEIQSLSGVERTQTYFALG